MTRIKPFREHQIECVVLVECDNCGGILTTEEQEEGCGFCAWQAEHDQRVENLRRYGVAE